MGCLHLMMSPGVQVGCSKRLPFMQPPKPANPPCQSQSSATCFTPCCQSHSRALQLLLLLQCRSRLLYHIRVIYVIQIEPQQLTPHRLVTRTLHGMRQQQHRRDKTDAQSDNRNARW